MDTSGVSLKEYGIEYNILKAIDNINMAWEEVTLSCTKGVWQNIWPSNKNYGTNWDKQISEIEEEVGLECVDPVGIIEVLESHSLLYDLAQ